MTRHRRERVRRHHGRVVRFAGFTLVELLIAIALFGLITDRALQRAQDGDPRLRCRGGPRHG